MSYQPIIAREASTRKGKKWDFQPRFLGRCGFDFRWVRVFHKSQPARRRHRFEGVWASETWLTNVVERPMAAKITSNWRLDSILPANDCQMSHQTGILNTVGSLRNTTDGVMKHSGRCSRLSHFYRLRGCCLYYRADHQY